MDEANERKMAKTFNMIVLGGLLKIRPVVSIESVIKALHKTLPERHHHLIPMNEEAIHWYGYHQRSVKRLYTIIRKGTFLSSHKSEETPLFF